MTLPTSPGRYRDNDGYLWSFNTDGTAGFVGTSVIWSADEVSRLARFGPFTPKVDDAEERVQDILIQAQNFELTSMEATDAIMAIIKEKK